MALTCGVAFYPESYLEKKYHSGYVLASFNQSLKTYKVCILGIYENYNYSNFEWKFELQSNLYITALF